MRDEDLDWEIYHILVAGEKYPVRKIIDICGVEKEDVLKSLTRLEKNCLIEIYQETQDDGSPQSAREFSHCMRPSFAIRSDALQTRLTAP